ncbi:response regulator [Siccirubricoccus deserti]
MLQVVAGSATLIGRDAEDAGAVRRRVRMVAEAVERGASITHRLLAFARRSELRREAIDPAGLLLGLREILAPSLGPKIVVRVEAAPGLPFLAADKGQLETALMNLGTNARDAMPEGGVLTLYASAEQVVEDDAAHPRGLPLGGYIRLAVGDTGVGMDATTLARVTEPFFTTKPAGQGTGLGLPMVKGFAEQSGGAFAESTPGRGTIVTLWFPQSENEAVAPAPVRALAPAPAGATATTQDAAPRVLIVDDEPAVCETLAAYLGANGHTVLTAAGSNEALALLDAGEGVDALVTDLTMPGMDGLALIREVRARGSRLPVLLLTGYAGDIAALALSDVEGGPFSLLRKPVSGAQLADRIAALLQVVARQQPAPGRDAITATRYPNDLHGKG